MSIIQRGIVFSIGTTLNVVLFIIHSRVILVVLDIANNFPTGPATPSMELLPIAVQLAIGGLQLGLIAYFIGGLRQQATVQRSPI